MRVFQLFTGLALPLLAVAAKAKPAKSTYEKHYTNTISSLPLTLDDASFAELTAIPRDFGSVLCLTAMEPQFGCKICQDFAPEFKMLSRSWTRGDKKGQSRLLFGTLDFTAGRQAFQSLKLDTAPVVLYYPPTTGPNAHQSSAPIRLDFTSGLVKAEQVHSWLLRHLPEDSVKPSFRRPLNYIRIAILIVTVMGLFTAATTLYPYFMPILQSRNVWAAGCIVAILLFTSGHMYNHIRGVPYVASDGRGGVQYFAPGFQNQFGMESQIVAAMYAVLAFATIYLALRVPRIQNAKMQQTAVLIWVGVMYGMYSFLMSIFRMKNSGYPYGLPPF